PLVFNVDTGDSALLVLADCADHVQLVSVPGVGVGDHRYTYRRGDASGVTGHLRHGDQAIVGIAQGCGSSSACHVRGLKTRLLDKAGSDAVVGAWRCDHPLAAKQVAEP